MLHYFISIMCASYVRSSYLFPLTAEFVLHWLNGPPESAKYLFGIS